ncbi:Clp protease N-terminal domain-containing protein, partial [Staphylococcus arlettae]|uniref:Clp protease N-terminal domain-containing protein n=2 Tax=Staphylococcus TaxID=1279 RepID=UPI000FF096E4
MDINQMTYKVQSVLQQAIEIAKNYENQNIEIEAILKAALTESDSLFKNILDRANIDTESLALQYDSKLSNYPTVQGEHVQYG